MSTTTIRLSDDLKERVARAAERAGVSPHNFIVQALREQLEAAEEQADLHRLAARRWAEFQRSGEAVDFDAMRHYVHELAAGRKPAAPRARRILP